VLLSQAILGRGSILLMNGWNEKSYLKESEVAMLRCFYHEK